MKAQRAVSGLIAGLTAMTWSFAFAPALPSAYAEEEQPETAAFSVECTGAATDGSFTAAVYLDAVPAGGLNAIDFAVAYDPAAVSISEVIQLYDTGADDAEAAVSPILQGTVFTYEETEGEIWIRWAIAMEDKYWLKEPGALFAVRGTVDPEKVEPGSSTALRIVPAKRGGTDTPSVVAGCIDDEDNIITYTAELTDGAVWMPIDETGATMYGDINMDGTVSLSDAVLLLRAIAEEKALCAAAYANADCVSDGELTVFDVTLILQVLTDDADASELGRRS